MFSVVVGFKITVLRELFFLGGGDENALALSKVLHVYTFLYPPHSSGKFEASSGVGRVAG